MRYAFAILLASHGLIHLMGFVKALYATDISKQVLGISKPIGSVWLIVFILFLISASAFLSQKKWFYIAFVAVLISQVLIVMAWQETKYGTIPNSIILLVSISAFSTERFNNKVDIESQQVFQNMDIKNHRLVSERDIINLPQIVQKWMRKSGAVGKEKIMTTRLKQVGKMRTKPNGRWMPFKADQYFNIENPAFIWKTEVEVMPLISMLGRDKLHDGKGEMLITLAGLIPIVNASKNHKIDSGSMLRFLAEMCWSPSAALNDYISWEHRNDTSARATFTQKGTSVAGVFFFNSDGDLVSFKASRYYGGTKGAKLESWVVEMQSIKELNGLRIPNRSDIIWKLNEGDFNWLNLEITDIQYNPLTRYNI